MRPSQLALAALIVSGSIWVASFIAMACAPGLASSSIQKVEKVKRYPIPEDCRNSEGDIIPCRWLVNPPLDDRR